MKARILILLMLCLSFALDVYAQKTDKQIFDELYEKAKAGDAEAQFDIATYYYRGKGVKKDYHYAFRWAEDAAKQNLPKAQRYLGLLYCYGQGVTKNYGWGHYYLEKAAAQGDKNAREKLDEFEKDPAILMQIAQGYEKVDRRSAVIYYKKLVAQGNKEAKNKLNGLLWTIKHFAKNCSICWTPDKEEKAKSGDRRAQYNIGYAFMEGKGLKQNEELGIYWLTKSADQGFDFAIEYLAGYYENKDCEKAVHYMKQLTKTDWNTAGTTYRQKIGRCYSHHKEYQKAIDWYIQVYNESSKDKYRYFSYQGICDNYERLNRYDKVVEWIKKAADDGVIDANTKYWRLGRCYEDQENYEQAEYWYTLALENGDHDAASKLKDIEKKKTGTYYKYTSEMMSLLPPILTKYYEELYRGWDKKRWENILNESNADDMHRLGYDLVNNPKSSLRDTALGKKYLAKAEARYKELKKNGNVRKMRYEAMELFLAELDKMNPKAWTIASDSDMDLYFLKKEKEKLYTKLGVADRQSYDFNAVCDYYEKAAYNGDYDAAYQWGEYYENYADSPRTRKAKEMLEKAFKGYLQAAEKGDNFAMYRVYMCYLRGYGVEKNPQKAAYWLEKSNYIFALDAKIDDKYREVYRETKGKGKQLEAAKQERDMGRQNIADNYVDNCWKKVFELKDYTAQLELGYIINVHSGGSKELRSCIVNKITRNFFPLLINLANSGDVEAMNMLGKHYLYYPYKDYKEAYQWYKKAALKGDLDAITQLASHKELGGESPLYWWEKAVEMGTSSNYILLNLANSYYKGSNGAKQDYAKAAIYYEKALYGGAYMSKSEIERFLELKKYLPKKTQTVSNSNNVSEPKKDIKVSESSATNVSAPQNTHGLQVVNRYINLLNNYFAKCKSDMNVGGSREYDSLTNMMSPRTPANTVIVCRISDVIAQEVQKERFAQQGTSSPEPYLMYLFKFNQQKQINIQLLEIRAIHDDYIYAKMKFTGGIERIVESTFYVLGDGIAYIYNGEQS